MEVTLRQACPGRPVNLAPAAAGCRQNTISSCGKNHSQYWSVSKAKTQRVRTEFWVNSGFSSLWRLIQVQEREILVDVLISCMLHRGSLSKQWCAPALGRLFCLENHLQWLPQHFLPPAASEYPPSTLNNRRPQKFPWSERSYQCSWGWNRKFPWHLVSCLEAGTLQMFIGEEIPECKRLFHIDNSSCFVPSISANFRDVDSAWAGFLFFLTSTSLWWISICLFGSWLIATLIISLCELLLLLSFLPPIPWPDPDHSRSWHCGPAFSTLHGNWPFSCFYPKCMLLHGCLTACRHGMAGSDCASSETNAMYCSPWGRE